MNKNNPRLLAINTLSRIHKGAYSNLQLNQVINRSNLEYRDVNLLTNIVYGVIQHRITLQYYTKYFVKRFNKLQPWVRELLYTAIYQMHYLNRVPNRAIFNESINIAKNYGNDGIRRMVTGTLHNIARKGLPDINKINNTNQRYSIKYSIPNWLISELMDQLGKDKTIHILKSINKPAKQSVRVNTSLINKQQLINKLSEERYEVISSSRANDGLIITNKSAIHSKAFREGLMTFQDESAMLPVQFMPIKPNSKVLDACSAPGGKTTQIAEKLSSNAGGKVVALDLHQNRLNRVKKNAQRMHVSDRVVTKALDARLIDKEFAQQTFDQILLDAPCSGLGLIRRKPEIRYEKTMKDILNLSKIQFNLLQNMAPMLKVGGTLTYSTCTILNQENIDVINKFLSINNNFKVIPLNSNLISNNNQIKIYPDSNADGFFICNLKRIS